MIVVLDIWLICAVAMVLLICFKIGFLCIFVYHRKAAGFCSTSSFLAIIFAVVGMIMCDVTYLFNCIQESCLPGPPKPVWLFATRIAYAFLMIQYQALSSLFFAILKRPLLQHWLQKIFFVITAVGAFCFLYIAFFGANVYALLATVFNTYSQLGFKAISLEGQLTFTSCLFLPMALAVNMMVAYRICMHENIPLLIRRQMHILIFYFMVPFLITECCQILFILLRSPYSARIPLMEIGSALFTYALWYFKDKLLRLRFLGLRSHIASVRQRAFLESYSSLIRQVEGAEGIEVLSALARQFCTTIFPVAAEHVRVHIYSPDCVVEGKYHAVLRQLSSGATEVIDFLHTARVINLHDLEFDLFYQECAIKRELLRVCHQLDAAVFVPLFSSDQLIGCISIEPLIVDDVVVDIAQREEMILFAGYLQAALVQIELTRYRCQQERHKKALELLKVDHRKLAHIRRSVQAKMRGELSHEIALIASRSGALVPLNRIAQELLSAARSESDSELIAACKAVAESVEKYKRFKRLTVVQNTERLSVAGSPNIEHAGTIVTVNKTGLLEVLGEQPGLLLGTDHWEYLLCLDSNEMSHALERFLPGTVHALVELKIELMRAALQSLPVWISAPRDDKRAVVQLIQSLSERKELIWYTVAEQEKAHSLIDALFGVDGVTSRQSGWVAQYDRIGTIVIEHVDLLSHTAQEVLAAFCASGEYRSRHGQQVYAADVRIIMTTKGQELSELVAAQKLLPKLVNQLHALRVYPLQELSDTDCIVLANGMLKQQAAVDVCKHIQLTDRESSALLQERPMSLNALQRYVSVLLGRRQENTESKMYIDQAVALSSRNKLVRAAAKLGKKALADQVLMTALWKYYGSQQQIAQILGVNRSSVSRRCKEYNLA